MTMDKFKLRVTLEERLQIKHMLDQGLSCSEISRRIQRSKNLVVTEVRRNGGRDVYEPYSAEERYKRIQIERIAKIKQANPPKVRVNNAPLAERVSNLEEQVKILSETLIQFMERQ